ncbi:MAG TPA: YwiC-like family protein [Capsulimonadaceae bacterium]|nr:YwiC-like family protein [Capsulimonadaceae bacterium]
MSQLALTIRTLFPNLRVSRPPIPHEHGAWVILYAPLFIALAAVHPANFAPLLLLVAVTGIFLSRNAIGLLLRRRGEAGTTFWLWVFLSLSFAGAGPLLLHFHAWALVQIGVIAAILFGLHALLLMIPARRRLDRSQWGELLAVGALTLTAPAAYIAIQGHLDGFAWCLWVACFLYFSSAIFYVKMLLAAAKVKGDFGWRDRWRVGRDTVIYHAVLAAIIILVTVVMGGPGAILSAIAYLPIIVRAFAGWARLSNKLPPLKRVGLAETFYSLWFAVFFTWSLLLPH